MTDQTAHAPAAKDQSPLGVFKRQLRQFADEMGNLDPAKREAMHNAAMIAVMKSPDLLKADRHSLFLALRLCADDGVMPDGKEAALIPYKGVVQYQIMVRGIITRVQNSGKVDTLWAEVVYKGEGFVIDQTEGDRRPRHDFDPLHRGPDGQANPADIVGVYAVARLANGFIDCEPLQHSEIMKIRAVARSKDVWDAWFSEKAKVAAIKRLGKRLPVDAEDRVLLERNEEFDLALEHGFEAPKSKFQLRAERARAAAQLAAPQPTVPMPSTPEPEGVTIDHHEAPEDRHWTLDEPAEFNAATPEFEDGQAAFASGSSATTCPYPKGTDRATDWLAGWHDARRASA